MMVTSNPLSASDVAADNDENPDPIMVAVGFNFV